MFGFLKVLMNFILTPLFVLLVATLLFQTIKELYHGFFTNDFKTLAQEEKERENHAEK